MTKRLSEAEAALRLTAAQSVLLLTHQNPDGDTLGSAFGLYRALKVLGKEAAVRCSDPFPKKFDYFTEETSLSGEPDLIVAVDIADEKLFGAALESYKGKVDLCIDHHVSNTGYAKALCLDGEAAAAAQIMTRIIRKMGVLITPAIADPLYTGIATDTGCFKFSNVTGETHRIAADLIECGADYVTINRKMFDTKSRARVQVEQAVLGAIEFYFDDRCALLTIPRKLVEETGVDEADLDGVSAMSRQIEGVEIGLTLREKDGFYKVSVRTTESVDASALCRALGGGGHVRAAGCTLHGDLETVKNELLNAVKRQL